MCVYVKKRATWKARDGGRGRGKDLSVEVYEDRAVAIEST